MYSLHLSDAGLESFRNLMSATFESYCRIDQMPKPALSVRYARTGGYRSMPEENPLNTWYQKCSIKGAASGPLAGKRIAIKDNVCVAGVQMMNGSVVLDGYVPDDADEQERRRRDCAPRRSCLRADQWLLDAP